MKPSRRIRPILAVTAAAAIAAGLWLSTAGLSVPVRIWTIVIAMLLPFAAIQQIGAIGDPESLPRIPAYMSSIVSLWLLAGITAATARFSGIDAGLLGLTSISWPAFLAWTTAQFVVALAVLGLARWLGVRESALLIRLLPETTAEKQVFAGLSVTAGFCEELVFRGFLIWALAQPFGLIPAVAISSAVFGLSHAYQDARGAARAGLLGVILALPVVLSGSLWPSIFAHIAIDLAGGIFLKDRLIGKLA